MGITRTIGPKGQIVIPKTIRDLLGIAVGEDVVVEVSGDKIIIKLRKENLGDALFTMLPKKRKKKIEKIDVHKMYEKEIEEDR